MFKPTKLSKEQPAKLQAAAQISPAANPAAGLLRVEVRPEFMTDSFDPNQPDYYWDFKIAFTSYWHEPITVIKRSMKPLAASVDWRLSPSHWDFWQAVTIDPGKARTVSHLVKLPTDTAIVSGELHYHTPSSAAITLAIPPFSCDCPYSQRSYQ